MTEECEFCLEEAKENMKNSIEHLKRVFQKIRAGKASPQMLDGVSVDYYGTLTPLNQVANISTPDPKQIIVQPWEKAMLVPIDKAILAANLGFNPINNGEILRIIVPALTEERRKDLYKKAKEEAELAKISIRNIRKSANDEAKKFKDDGISEDEIKKLETEIQNITNEYSKEVDKLLEAKEKDIMTI
ncbi:MAG: ribosome recycling factor [Bacteroidales bacterium]|nr:ribosome recycling factor [Bacteroidales bacterium]